MRQAVTSLEGVVSAQVSFEDKRAEVVYRPVRVDPEQLVEAVEQAGFEAELARHRGKTEAPADRSPEGGDEP